MRQRQPVPLEEACSVIKIANKLALVSAGCKPVAIMLLLALGLVVLPAHQMSTEGYRRMALQLAGLSQLAASTSSLWPADFKVRMKVGTALQTLMGSAVLLRTLIFNGDHALTWSFWIGDLPLALLGLIVLANVMNHPEPAKPLTKV